MGFLGFYEISEEVPDHHQHKPSCPHLWCALAPMRPRVSLGSRAMLNAADVAAAAPKQAHQM